MTHLLLLFALAMPQATVPPDLSSEVTQLRAENAALDGQVERARMNNEILAAWVTELLDQRKHCKTHHITHGVRSRTCSVKRVEKP